MCSWDLPSFFTCDPLSLSSHTSLSCPTQWDRILLVAMTFGLPYSVMQADGLSRKASPLIAG